MRGLRRYSQICFLGFFVLIMVMMAQGRLQGHRVTLLLDSSALNGLGTLLAAHSIARTLWVGMAILALTFLLGRFFCGWICPLGTLLHAVSWLARPTATAERIARNRYEPQQRLKYLLLMVLLVSSALGAMQVGLFDPIALLTRTTAVIVSPTPHYGWLIIAIFTAILLLNLYRPRFWCRVLCPLGALLGLTARFTPGGIVRDQAACTNCQLCNRDCPAACSPSESVRMTECFLCGNCTADCPEKALAWRFQTENDETESAAGLSRRQFVGAALGGVAAWTAYRADTVRGFPMRIRPPGALAEPDFLDRCIKCGACMRVCPTGVLRPALLESGVAGLATPVLDMNRGYCELNCTLCSQVCPTGAIRRLTIPQKTGTDERAPIKIGTAMVDRSRCIPWSFGRSCLVCQEVCPVSPKAIGETLAPHAADDTTPLLHRPDVDPSRCIGCGVCQHECPVQDKPAIRVTAAGESRQPGGGFYLG